ncbi:MAG: flagellar basal body P-ring formation protein FlgA [Gammaproteobacteria bacterium]|nr:flagellar basal body P-ring formation protein FlgA [Gammaproteobacteria bacterium]
MHYRSTLLSLLLLCGSEAIWAASLLELHSNIRETARRYVVDRLADTTGRVEISTGELDSRLHLQACDHPLESFTTSQKRVKKRQTIGVRCTGSKPWTLYVPVTVKIMKKVFVAHHPLPRGTLLLKEGIKLEERDITQLRRGFYIEERRLIGKTLKKSLIKGAEITPSHLTTEETIKRGNRVIISAKSRLFSVKMAGKALSAGKRGDRIKVINLSSKRKLEATVIAPGLVEVTL